MSGQVKERRFYAKVYSREQNGQQTYQVLRALWDEASAGGVGFTVGRPIAYLSDLRTLLQGEAPGTSLWNIILHQKEEVTPAVRKAAKALATLHLSNVVAPQRRLLRDEAADLKERGKDLQRVCPHLATEIERTVGAVVTSLVEETPATPIHGDLTLDDILVNRDILALIDLDEFAQGDPLLDVTEVLAYLVFMPLYSAIPPDYARTTARAFCEEYFAHAPEAWRPRLPVHYAAAVLRLATGWFLIQAPDWPDKIEGLINEAKDSLEGKVW